jgi:uncharacterized protein YjcR
MSMRTHADIVCAAGKPEDIAERRGVSAHTVRSWIQRDSIPPEHWAGFVIAGWAGMDELVSARKPRKRAAA